MPDLTSKKESSFSSISNNFFRFNIYIILGIAIILLILIQPYNSFCRSTKKCNPIMLQALMPTKLGERNLYINFQIPQNSNFDISLKKSKIFAITGTKIKNEIYLKNTSSEDHEITLLYDLQGAPQEFIKKLDCPCLLKRVVAAGKEEKISIYFFIKKEFEMKFDKNEVRVAISLK